MVGSDRATAPFCQPSLAQSPPVIFGVSAPDTGFLVGLQCILETVFLDQAGRTDFNCGLDLVDGRTGSPYREE